MALKAPLFPSKLLAVCGLLLAAHVPGQNVDPSASIEAALHNKPLFLRGCWIGKHLDFDAQGIPIAKYPVQSFTLCGIDVEHVQLKGSTLEIRGRAAGLELSRTKAPRRVALSDSISVQIEGNTSLDFSSALQRVFAADWKEIAPSPSDYWQQVGAYLLSRTGAKAITPATSTGVPPPSGPTGPDNTEAPLTHPGSDPKVRPPVLLTMPTPRYSAAAKEERYSGQTEVYLIVEQDGTPSHLAIIRPLGLGLDEEALASVAQYRFKPAMRDGKPIRIGLYVAVNF